MDLLYLVLIIALIGFGVWFITTHIPMPPYWATAISILTFIVILIFLFSKLGIQLPNVMGR